MRQPRCHKYKPVEDQSNEPLNCLIKQYAARPMRWQAMWCSDDGDRLLALDARQCQGLDDKAGDTQCHGARAPRDPLDDRRMGGHPFL